MRALVQRVARASVDVEGEEVGSIGNGLVVLLGIAKGDDEQDARYIADKITNLRIFSDEANRFNRSVLDIGAELFVISQFTLYGNTRKGRRPDFTDAAPPAEAEKLYLKTAELFRESGLRVETGRFQEYMRVRIENDGPVTLMIDSADRHRPRRA